MKRFDAKHLAAFSLITILPMSMGCHLSLFDSGIPGSGVSKSESRTVDDFQVIEMAGSGEMNIQCGQEPTLNVTADDNLLELLDTQTDDGKLKIEWLDSISPKITPVFDMTTDTISEISVAGSCKVDMVDFDGDTLDLEVAGSGNFRIVGVVEKLNLSVAGSGRADLTELVAKDVNIEIAGSGSAKVHAIQSLDVEIAGSGNIQYIGDPKITKSIMGSGSVKKMAEPVTSEASEIEVDASPSDASPSDEATGSEDDEEDE